MFVIILVIPLTLAESIDCEISIDNVTWGNINTTMWGGCLDADNGLAYAQNLDCGTDYYIRCQNDTHDWGYQSFETEDCGEREPMAALAITVFILIITGGLFYWSTKKVILQNKYANIIARRSLLVLGIYLMILNSAIMATIAADAGIELTQEMFFYMRLFGYVGYPAMLYLMLSALLQSLRELKFDKKNKRTGNDEDGE